MASTLFQQNYRIKSKKVCEKLHLSYQKKGQLINNYLSEFRSNPNFGNIPSEPIDLPHCRKWVWNKVVFTDKWKSVALSNGWKQSKNRNRMLVFNEKLGSVQWFESGTVLVLLKGSSNLAMAKTLFCRAFRWLDNLDLSKLCEGSLREENRHWVFDVGVDLPRFKLDSFKKTHGLTIRSDGSHPGKLEVEETVPLSQQETNNTLRLFNKTLKEVNKTQKFFAVNMKSHQKLVETVTKRNETENKLYEVLIKKAEERAAAHRRSGENLATRFLKWMVTPL